MKQQASSLYLLLFLIVVSSAPAASAADRPNFVWLVSEDNSKHYLRLFDEHGAPTPQIEALAAQGVVFDRAFSCAPVCSVARTTLITSCYAPRIATQYHRRSEPATLPPGLQMFPAYLRAAGYYATNQSKKDYNAAEGDGVWDESSGTADWRGRSKKATPFFHMQSFAQSHESSLHFSAKQMKNTPTDTDPASVTLPPYFPDTPTFRYTLARYHDRMRSIDDEIGNVVAALDQDGLLEDTFIFYFGDHGGVLPRGKGYLYESGLHVPLVVRIPEKWAHLTDRVRGSRAKGFVSFVDFGPTLLQLAGLPVPELSDGRPFLGKGIAASEVESRDETFGYADRFDEKYEMIRSLRKGRFKYLRNFQAYYPDALQNNYRYRMLAYQEWRELYQTGKLNAVQSQFFNHKPAELLYDLDADPHEVKNLAGDPAYSAVLIELRSRLARTMKKWNDLSLYPESLMVSDALRDPIAFGRAHSAEISELLDIASLAVQPFESARPALETALQSENRWKRYWGLTVCSVFGQDAASMAGRAKELLDDSEPHVRVRAAEFLGSLNAGDPRPVLYEVLKSNRDPITALMTLNTVVYLRDGKPGYDFKVTQAEMGTTKGEVERRLEYLAP